MDVSTDIAHMHHACVRMKLAIGNSADIYLPQQGTLPRETDLCSPGFSLNETSPSIIYRKKKKKKKQKQTALLTYYCETQQQAARRALTGHNTRKITRPSQTRDNHHVRASFHKNRSHQLYEEVIISINHLSCRAALQITFVQLPTPMRLSPLESTLKRFSTPLLEGDR